MIDRIQTHLEAIYGLRCELKASDHLVDADSARALGGSGDREQLLVHQSDDALELALFVDPGLIERLEQSSPFDDLNGFCEATEGVSHFMYLVRAASLDREVSLLELEAQGEIDKFASCALLGWQNLDARALHEQLFDRVGYRADLADHERWRYGEANRLARLYCKRLLELIAARRMDQLLSELRHTYRMGAEAKLQRLSST
ncbi:MAG: hypothetical protein IPJ65_09085 [Archangiaceae bacterium]|nr:hypothetical protein [Archangiaceae bacterium]